MAELTSSTREAARRLGISDTTDPRKRLQGCHRSRHALGRLDAVGTQIGHGPAPTGDREPLALLHGPQQARQLGLGLEGADAGIHGSSDLVHKLVYKQ